jgi:hypothetical protein
MNLAFGLQKDKNQRDDPFWQPYKLVSVWDMLEFYALNFVRTIEFMSAWAAVSTNKQISKMLLTKLQNDISELHCTLLGMEAEHSALRLGRILDALENGSPRSESSLNNDVREMFQTLLDDLKTKVIYMVPYSKVGYFNDASERFSRAVRENFPSAVEDMDEASQCFALNRYTACVFHLMRIMEAGLNVMAKSLNLEVAKNWHRALTDIEREINFWNTTPRPFPAWKAIEPSYAEAATHFRWVKDAWRNYTMHIVAHYSDNKTTQIFSNVSSFMSDLAQWLHE